MLLMIGAFRNDCGGRGLIGHRRPGQASCGEEVPREVGDEAEHHREREPLDAAGDEEHHEQPEHTAEHPRGEPRRHQVAGLDREADQRSRAHCGADGEGAEIVGGQGQQRQRPGAEADDRRRDQRVRAMPVAT